MIRIQVRKAAMDAFLLGSLVALILILRALSFFYY